MRAASPGLSGWIVRGPTRECPGVLESREWEDAHIIVDLARIEVQDLLAAERDLKLSGLFKRLSRYEVLVLDDLGYVQQSREEMEVLFSLLSERYERGSVMLSSNLAFSGWEGIFKDAMMTAAAIDRLVHHCVIVELNVPSYRVEQAKKTRPTPPATE
jgi:DNA replication protein DnaC